LIADFNEIARHRLVFDDFRVVKNFGKMRQAKRGEAFCTTLRLFFIFKASSIC